MFFWCGILVLLYDFPRFNRIRCCESFGRSLPILWGDHRKLLGPFLPNKLPRVEWICGFNYIFNMISARIQSTSQNSSANIARCNWSWTSYTRWEWESPSKMEGFMGKPLEKSMGNIGDTSENHRAQWMGDFFSKPCLMKPEGNRLHLRLLITEERIETLRPFQTWSVCIVMVWRGMKRTFPAWNLSITDFHTRVPPKNGRQVPWGKCWWIQCSISPCFKLKWHLTSSNHQPAKFKSCRGLAPTATTLLSRCDWPQDPSRSQSPLQSNVLDLAKRMITSWVKSQVKLRRQHIWISSCYRPCGSAISRGYGEAKKKLISMGLLLLIMVYMNIYEGYIPKVSKSHLLVLWTALVNGSKGSIYGHWQIENDSNQFELL